MEVGVGNVSFPGFCRKVVSLLLNCGPFGINAGGSASEEEMKSLKQTSQIIAFIIPSLNN